MTKINTRFDRIMIGRNVCIITRVSSACTNEQLTTPFFFFAFYEIRQQLSYLPHIHTVPLAKCACVTQYVKYSNVSVQRTGFVLNPSYQV